MARRRTGSIRKRAEGVFEIAVTAVRRAAGEEYDRWLRDFRMDTERGVETARRVIRLYETVRGTREDAERRVRELQVEADRGVMPGTGGTVRELLSWWLEQVVRPQRKPATWESYRRHCRLYVGPALGDMRIKELRPHHVQTFQNELARVLAPKTVTLSRQVLNQAMEDARQEPAHPGESRDLPGGQGAQGVVRPKRGPRRRWTRCRSSSPTPRRDGHRFACPLPRPRVHVASASARPWGLTWKDVDVARSAAPDPQPDGTHRKPTGCGTAPPRARRAIGEVPTDTWHHRRAHGAPHGAGRHGGRQLGERWEDLRLVFPNTTGGFIHRAQPERVTMKPIREGQSRPHASSGTSTRRMIVEKTAPHRPCAGPAGAQFNMAIDGPLLLPAPHRRGQACGRGRRRWRTCWRCRRRQWQRNGNARAGSPGGVAFRYGNLCKMLRSFRRTCS